jgi:fluoride ion exporter CrcB/FEX
MILGALISLTGYAMFLGSTNTDLRYGAMFVGASGCFLFGSLANAQASANVVSDTARSSVSNSQTPRTWTNLLTSPRLSVLTR